MFLLIDLSFERFRSLSYQMKIDSFAGVFNIFHSYRQ